MKIMRLRSLGTSCPSQWRGQFTDGEPLYIRYRWGYLAVYKGGTDGVDGKEVFGKQIGDSLDGDLSLDRLLKILTKAKLIGIDID